MSVNAVLSQKGDDDDFCCSTGSTNRNSRQWVLLVLCGCFKTRSAFLGHALVRLHLGLEVHKGGTKLRFPHLTLFDIVVCVCDVSSGDDASFPIFFFIILLRLHY